MRRSLLTLILLASFSLIHAQFTSPSVSIVNSKLSSHLKMQHGKTKTQPSQCGVDTLDYGYEKLITQLINGSSSSLRAINISDGYRLGQFYVTPGDVTIHGFKFYAWALDTGAVQVNVFCEVYEAGADSLPTGLPLASDTLQIDTAFKNGVLDSIAKFANFSNPITVNKPFIVVVRSIDSTRVAIVTNDYARRDGFGENYACGSIGGRWYRALNLNIGGTTLDCDMLLEPFVSYKLYSDFEFKDCYNYRDSIKFTNKSSPFLFSPMYNIYKFYQDFRGYNYEIFSHRWSYGGGFYYASIDGETKFTTPRNVNVGLRTIRYSFTGGYQCDDTTIKTVYYRPEQVSLYGDDKVCKGDAAEVVALSDAQIFWFKGVVDTAAVNIGPEYVPSDSMLVNDTIFAQAINYHCQSTRKRHIVQVVNRPEIPSVKDDSICLNSMANLVAPASVGETFWYADSTSTTVIHKGDFLQIGPLTRDTMFYAKTINDICTHDGRVKVRAFVRQSFAPQDPTTSGDTTICLLDKPIQLSASSQHTLRWYDVAAGGTAIDTGTTLLFAPQKRGVSYRYVDAYNGKCASSRIPIRIAVNHFPRLLGLKDDTACTGEVVRLDYETLQGDLMWFEDATGGTELGYGNAMEFPDVQSTKSYYLQTKEGTCADSVRYKWTIHVIPFGVVAESSLDSQVCDGLSPNLMVKPTVGQVEWLNDKDSVIAVADALQIDPPTESLTLGYRINNKGCINSTERHTVVWRLMPDANYDYEVRWRDVTFASKLISQGDYIWHFDDGSDTSMGTDVTHHYYNDGTYNVSLIVASPYDCIDTVTKAITINSASIDDVWANAMRVYPNPTHGLMTVTMPLAGQYRLVLVNRVGQIVYSTFFDGAQIVLDLQRSSISSGLYQVVVSGTDGAQYVTSVLSK